MKTIFLWVGLCLATWQSQAQVAVNSTSVTQTNTIASQSIVGYQTGVQDGNSRVWQKIIQTTDAQGNITYQTNNAYTELATGLNHLVNGQWIPSSEEIDISADGNSALATNGQHQAYFPGDIYSGQIELVTPDGKQLYSRPVGLSYDDGTHTVLIAELTNSTGEVEGNNQVVYVNAFTGLKADIRYTYTKAGFEQDIILRERPPTPASFGLNPDTAKLQVLTEFFNPPQPTITATTVSTAAGDLENDNLSFGTMAMVPGKAFMMGATTPSAAVEKQWLLLNNRQILVEEVPVVSIADELSQLPLPATTSIQPNSPLNVVSTKQLLPIQHLATISNKHPMLMAQVTPSLHGLVLDYQTVNGTFTNFTFQGDTTYYISGTVNLSGTNIFEGGTVIKYTNSSSAELVMYASYGSSLWAFQTGPYHPAIFTSMNDNTVGDTISGSNGNPTNTSATYLCLPDDNGYPEYPIQYARFSYAYNAIYQETRVTCSPVLDCQFVHCSYAIVDAVTALFGVTPVQELHNVLMANCGVGILTIPGFSLIIDGENMTADQVGWLSEEITSTTITGTYTNCIFTGVSNYLYEIIPPYTPYGSTTFFDCATNSSGSGIYQTAGAGNYYLATGSTNQNAGTTNIDSALLADLRQKTTYPPLFLTNQTISASTNFNPQALRDTNSSPDLGYHYDPLDYCWNGLNLTNATMTLTNGVAIGVYGYSGLTLQNGATLVSQGMPLTPNQLVSYHSVQEQSTLLSATNTTCTYLGATADSSVIRLRFTDISSVAMPHDTIYVVGGTGLNSFNLMDCQVSAMLIYIWDSLVVSPGYVGITNNIFWRSHLDFGNLFNTYPLNFYNNLCFGGEADFYGGSDWQVRNNLFDTVTTTEYSGVVNDHNGYHDASELSIGSAGDVEISDPVEYEMGPLGNYYYPTDDYNLSYLLNAGSTTASALGLYHYTVTTNQVIESTNIVSIGYHYVATDTNGIPLDSNGDGIPDYLEDANGDGVYDAGDLADWLIVINDTVPAAYYTANGLDSSNPLIGIQDADWDGLLNQQEYLYGSNPQVSEGFGIWVSTPTVTSGIP